MSPTPSLAPFYKRPSSPKIEVGGDDGLSTSAEKLHMLQEEFWDEATAPEDEL